MDTETERPSRIVVGVDGSPSSRAALAWAVRQAELTGARVEAVTAWQYPAGYGWPAPVLQSFDFAAAASQSLSETVAAVAAGHEGVEIRQRVIQEHPATALLAAADGADLLVVGNRGRGGFAGTLLGSVSQHCVHHASCPVLVIRAPTP
ncbi:universal stress protein [Kitasatospora phosalacinea]|uniref:Universal stress protein n=1 Tax=Kitasatospora phosalacinea TaxID=2065 RepID=A0ABW6GG44_9ACTN